MDKIKDAAGVPYLALGKLNVMLDFRIDHRR